MTSLFKDLEIMKKTIITMLIALVAMFASAETYNYLKFTKTNGSTVTYSVEGLKLTYDCRGTGHVLQQRGRRQRLHAW